MKDYSKVKYVKPSVDGVDITKGKVYCFNYLEGHAGDITDNVGGYRFIYIPKCAYINDNNWIPCDKDGNEIEV